MSVEDALERLADRERAVWAAAIALYGVGDAVTTIYGLSVGGVAEVGPIAGPAMDVFGTYAILGIKVVAFALFYLAWRLLRTPGRVAVPLALAAVGAVVTAWNVVVIATAL